MSKVNIYSYPQKSFTPSPVKSSPRSMAYPDSPQTQPVVSETHRPRIGIDFQQYLSQPSENEKRLKVDNLLKQIYSKEEKLYVKDDSQARSLGVIDRPKSTIIKEPPYAIYEEFKGASSTSKPRSVSSHNDFNSSSLYDQVKQTLYSQRSSNSPDKTPQIYAKTLPRDKSFDPINGVTRQYDVIRSPVKFQDQQNTSDESMPIKERYFRRGLFNPITGKTENNYTNRSFSYGEQRASPLRAISSSRFSDFNRNLSKPFANINNAINSSFDKDSILKLLNSQRVVKGAGYQNSNIF